MKVKDIEIGGVYSNGKGRVRKVIDRGTQFVLYSSQCCRDTIRYEIVNDGTKNNRTAGERHNMTVQAFATWAKERL